MFSLPTLPTLFLLSTSAHSVQGLTAECSRNSVAEDHEVTVCPCAATNHIDCGHGAHIITVDVVFGTLSGEQHCNSHGTCSTAVVCEYKMSQHCDDKQFLDILAHCNGQRLCGLHHSNARNMSCKGVFTTPDYTGVKYRCVKDADRPRVDVCGSGQMPPTAGENAYLTSPNLPNPDNSNQHRLCCCRVTGIDDFYLLHYETMATESPFIQFSTIEDGLFHIVDFKNKIANVRIHTNWRDTYYLTWRQDGAANSGVFVAWLKGRSATRDIKVACRTTGCPGHQTSTTLRTSPTSNTAKSATTPVSGSTAYAPSSPTTIATKDGRPVGLDNENDGVPIGLITGITVGALMLVAVVVTVAVLIVRKHMTETENSEYTTPGPAESPNTPNTYSSLSSSDTNATYEEVVDPAYILMGTAPADVSQSKPAAANDTYKIEDRSVVYQNSGFSTCQNA